MFLENIYFQSIHRLKVQKILGVKFFFWLSAPIYSSNGTKTYLDVALNTFGKVIVIGCYYDQKLQCTSFMHTLWNIFICWVLYFNFILFFKCLKMLAIIQVFLVFYVFFICNLFSYGWYFQFAVHHP